MSEFEQTNITIKRGDSSPANLSRKKVYEIRSGLEETQRREKEKQIANYKAYGNGNFIQEGSKDRLLGKLPVLPPTAVSESDIFSYYGGYYKKGTRNLLLYTSGKIPDFISEEELLKAVGYNIADKEKIQTQEIINKILKIIGYVDSQNPEIIYENLPLEIRNNIYYGAGYNKRLENTNNKKR